jgi:glycosyltransferase involved in cell wall biosynthesis
MKILHIFDFFSPHGGGTVDVIYKLARAQAQMGHEVTIYTSDFKLDKDYVASLPEVKIYPFHCISSLGLFYVMPSLVRAARGNLKDFDIIHLNCFRSFQNIVIHYYAKKYKVPYVLDTRGSLPRKAAGEGNLKWLLRGLFDVVFGYKILNDASVVVALNKFGRNEYNEFGVKGDKIVTIPHFFPVEDFTHLPPPGQFRSQYRIEGKHIVMSFGRINYIKGLDFLIESFYELSRSRQDTILAIVGPDDGYQGKLKNLISRLNLDNRVLFTGFLGGQNKLAALVDADVVVQPSRYELSAWAPVEAVLCGTPIIVSSNTGSGEDISRIGAGYLVDYGDKNQMVQTIQAILDDPSEAKTKVSRAQEYIANNLQISKRVEDYERLYQQCIESNLQARRG